MKARLLVFATSLCLTAAFAMPVSAASTTTTQSQTAATAKPEIACNLKGCWEVHKKTTHKTETKTSSAASRDQPSTPPHP